MRLPMKRLTWAIACVCMGCGGAETASDREETSSGAESFRLDSDTDGDGDDDGIAIEGLDGTIDPHSVEVAVNGSIPSFAECFGARYGDLDVLSGEFTLGFRIARDGSVITARLLQSTVGDRETEHCIVRVARKVRFAKPNGGEAEASHSLAMELPDDVRPPVLWPVAKAQNLVSSNGGPALKVRCGAESAELLVTAYVQRGGRAMAVGASGDVEATALDCVADAVSGWRFADPGSYPAKVSFSF
jgi:hypothetical protein